MDPLIIIAVLAAIVAGLALYAFRLSGQIRAAETKLASSDERAGQADLLRMQLSEVARERDAAREEAAKKVTDPLLRESAAILADAIGLLGKDAKLAAQVLPESRTQGHWVD
mgnify:CR=1 FL=1